MSNFDKGVLIFILISFFISYLLLFFADKPTAVALSESSGFYNNLTGMEFLIASILLFITFWKVRRFNRPDIFGSLGSAFLLGLSFLSFMGFGEVMRWGQRIFHFPTPAWLHNANAQQEFDIHNLHGLQDNPWGVARWFSIFCLVYCCLIPYLDASHLRFSAWLKRIGLPVVPLWLGLCFLLAYGLSKAMEYGGWLGQLSGKYIKECHFGLLFVFMAIFFLQKVMWESRKKAA